MSKLTDLDILIKRVNELELQICELERQINPEKWKIEKIEKVIREEKPTYETWLEKNKDKCLPLLYELAVEQPVGFFLQLYKDEPLHFNVHKILSLSLEKNNFELYKWIQDTNPFGYFTERQSCGELINPRWNVTYKGENHPANSSDLPKFVKHNNLKAIKAFYEYQMLEDDVPRHNGLVLNWHIYDRKEKLRKYLAESLGPLCILEDKEEILTYLIDIVEWIPSGFIWKLCNYFIRKNQVDKVKSIVKYRHHNSEQPIYVESNFMEAIKNNRVEIFKFLVSKLVGHPNQFPEGKCFTYENITRKEYYKIDIQNISAEMFACIIPYCDKHGLQEFFVQADKLNRKDIVKLCEDTF